ncbi:HD domain-containing protein [Nocardiopsis rhodophaea]|uniref:HD domain-containing protein n=1 Tax=Nocardiopsis rhodophaea TaxID=280238 RepID=UPI0031DFC5F7
MSDLFTRFDCPDTTLTRAAWRFVTDAQELFLANHSARTYLFGRALAEGQGLRAGRDFDDELLFLGCVLHDLGLAGTGDGGQRFEVDGADRAAGFLREEGVDAERVTVVWDAVALHTSVGIAERKSPEIAFTHAGAGCDLFGPPRDALAKEYTDDVHAVFPRLNVGDAIASAVVEQAVANPAKAAPLTFPAHLAAELRPGALALPTWSQMTSAEHW